MYEAKPLTAEEPKLILVADQKPPMGRKIYMVSRYGIGFLGDYHEEYGIVAWACLPKLTMEQKERLQNAEESR